MIKYEYKFVSLPLTEEQKNIVSMNLVKMEELSNMILKIVNEEGSEGWEALYPFIVDIIWFRRPKNLKKKK